MFQAPPSPQAGPPPPTGGEFTQFFKPSPGGMPVGPQFPSVSQFPQAATAPAPPPPQPEGGEYTRMFGPGTLSGAPGPAPAPPPAAPAPPPPASYGPGGGATQAFRAAPSYPPAAVPQGPSEYTRMMSAPSNLAPPPAAAPPAAQMPGMPQMGMPQMPYMQPPAMPHVAPPQVTIAPVSAPAAKSSNTLLIVIFCLLAFLAGGIVVYLLVRPK